MNRLSWLCGVSLIASLPLVAAGNPHGNWLQHQLRVQAEYQRALHRHILQHQAAMWRHEAARAQRYREAMYREARRRTHRPPAARPTMPVTRPALPIAVTPPPAIKQVPTLATIPPPHPHFAWYHTAHFRHHQPLWAFSWPHQHWAQRHHRPDLVVDVTASTVNGGKGSLSMDVRLGPGFLKKPVQEQLQTLDQVFAGNRLLRDVESDLLGSQTAHFGSVRLHFSERWYKRADPNGLSPQERIKRSDTRL